MCDLTELMPIGRRMQSSNIFVGENTNKHILNREFKVIEK